MLYPIELWVPRKRRRNLLSTLTACKWLFARRRLSGRRLFFSGIDRYRVVNCRAKRGWGTSEPVLLVRRAEACRMSSGNNNKNKPTKRGNARADPWEVEYIHRELPTHPREEIERVAGQCK